MILVESNVKTIKYREIGSIYFLVLKNMVPPRPGNYVYLLFHLLFAFWSSFEFIVVSSHLFYNFKLQYGNRRLRGNRWQFIKKRVSNSQQNISTQQYITKPVINWLWPVRKYAPNFQIHFLCAKRRRELIGKRKPTTHSTPRSPKLICYSSGDLIFRGFIRRRKRRKWKTRADPQKKKKKQPFLSLIFSTQISGSKTLTHIFFSETFPTSIRTFKASRSGIPHYFLRQTLF